MELGCSFAELCQAMERQGMLQLQRHRKGGASWEVMGSRLEARLRGPPPPHMRGPPPPANDGSDRWVMD